MLAKELQIYKDTFDLIDVIINTLNDFPRYYRYTIGQKMLDEAYEMQRHIIRANRHKEVRVQMCEEIIEGVEGIGVGLRLASKHKYISHKHEARMTELLVKIGRQANGWKNNVR